MKWKRYEGSSDAIQIWHLVNEDSDYVYGSAGYAIALVENGDATLYFDGSNLTHYRLIDDQEYRYRLNHPNEMYMEQLL